MQARPLGWVSVWGSRPSPSQCPCPVLAETSPMQRKARRSVPMPTQSAARGELAPGAGPTCRAPRPRTVRQQQLAGAGLGFRPEPGAGGHADVDALVQLEQESAGQGLVVHALRGSGPGGPHAAWAWERTRGRWLGRRHARALPTPPAALHRFQVAGTVHSTAPNRCRAGASAGRAGRLHGPGCPGPRPSRAWGCRAGHGRHPLRHARSPIAHQSVE